MAIIYLAQYKSKNNTIHGYIGKTDRKLEERIEEHKRDARSNSPLNFHQAMLNFGIENWSWSTLHICDTSVANEKEKEYIEIFCKTNMNVLNIASAIKIKKDNTYSIKNFGIPKSNKQHYDKSEMGKRCLRASGKLKPIINLKTNQIFESINDASKIDNISKSTIKNSCTTGNMAKDGSKYAFLDLDDKPVLTPGHNSNRYIGKNAKKVKNLINGKIYENTVEAAHSYGVSISTIEGAAKGKYLIVKQQYVFCFLDKNYQEIISPQHIKALEKVKNKDVCKYVAWHVDDKEMKEQGLFVSIQDLCNKLNVDKSHIKDVCEGKRSHTNKWRIAYYDQETKLPILKNKHLQKANKVIKKIVCLNDQKIFNNCVEAAKHYSINREQIRNCAEGNQKSVYQKLKVTSTKIRLRFAFLDINNNSIMTPTHKAAEESLSNRGHKRIMLLRNNQIFNSRSEYCRETGISQKRAQRYLTDNSIDLLENEFIELN